MPPQDRSWTCPIVVRALRLAVTSAEATPPLSRVSGLRSARLTWTGRAILAPAKLARQHRKVERLDRGAAYRVAGAAPT